MQSRVTSNLPFILSLVWIALFASIAIYSIQTALWITLLLPIVFYLIFRELITRAFFISPPRTHEVKITQGWQLIEREREGFPVRCLLNLIEGSEKLVVLIHGWTSSTTRMENRLKWWKEQGFSTIALEVRGHGHAEDEPEWTAEKVAEDLLFLLNELETDLKGVKRINFYGHSLGGFILLRLMRNEGWWSELNDGIILESPMSSYKMILEENRLFSSFLKPVFSSWLMRALNILHPQSQLKTLTDLETPNWGMPNVRTLIIQSEFDSRLGRAHYSHLMDSFEKSGLEELLSHHLVFELEHSRNDDCVRRDELIIDWL